MVRSGTEDDAAGVGTVVAGWEDEDNEAGWRTTCDNKSWGCSHGRSLNNGTTMSF
jgi:hypothetical protein